MIETAFILPILVMLLLGLVSGGTAYQRKLSLQNGAREGARYGATLPVGNVANLNAWLDDVKNTSVNAVDDGLPTGLSGRYICVAYVFPNGTGTADRTTRRVEDSAGTVTYSNNTCFTDSRPATERRVQVVLQRISVLDAMLVRQSITLEGKSVARFEAVAG